MHKKLKAVYTLAEQLYTGAQRAICTASNSRPPPSLIKETLEKLSMMPARIVELKKSAARSGALTALTRTKAWISDLSIYQNVYDASGKRISAPTYDVGT